MNRSRRCAAAAVLILSPASVCLAGEAPSGFTFCVSPLRPACVDAPSADEAECDAEVQTFISTVFKYRECLGKETERAVREANDALEAWKCRTGKLKCR